MKIRNRWRIAKLKKFLGLKLSDKPGSSNYFNKRHKGTEQ